MAKRKKELSPHYKANDDGGFGNPPVSGQFNGKPGPGRPRGGTTLKTAIQNLLKQRVTMIVDGKRVELSMVDALTRRLGKEMLTGSMKALEIGLEWAEKYGPKEEDLRNIGGNYETFSFDEMKVLRALFIRSLHGQGKQTRDHMAGNQIGLYRAYLRDDGYLGLERLSKDQLPPNEIDQI